MLLDRDTATASPEALLAISKTYGGSPREPPAAAQPCHEGHVTFLLTHVDVQIRQYMCCLRARFSLNVMGLISTCVIQSALCILLGRSSLGLCAQESSKLRAMRRPAELAMHACCDER